MEIIFVNGPRPWERPGRPLKVEFRTMSGDFKLQQKSASENIFTINLVIEKAFEYLGRFFFIFNSFLGWKMSSLIPNGATTFKWITWRLSNANLCHHLLKRNVRETRLQIHKGRRRKNILNDGKIYVSAWIDKQS